MKKFDLKLKVGERLHKFSSWWEVSKTFEEDHSVREQY